MLTKINSMRKQLITLGVVVGSLAIAFVLLYFAIVGMKSKPTTDASATSTPAAKKSSLLPLGDTIDFSKINQYNGSGRQNAPIKVSPSEIGKPLDKILKN
jgi:hypothetical protein